MGPDVEEYPLYPELSDDGKAEAQKLIDKFKAEMTKVANDVIGDFYCDVAYHIESDSWTNYKNHLLDGLRDYNNRKIHGDYDFKEIRQAILNEHRDDIVADLNKDMVKEIESLKEQLEFQIRVNQDRF